MSASVKKDHSVSPQPGGGSATSIPGGRPASLLSSTSYSRLVEKAELQNLNDRLACYIDRVRYLENENARLTVEIQTARETVSREASNIKSMYEHELSDARKLLDETASEKAKLEIDTKRIWEKNYELKTKLDKTKKYLVTVKNNAEIYESRCSDLSNKYKSALKDRDKFQDSALELKKKNDSLRKQLDDLRKHLEAETLARVDLENTVQSLSEELAFKDQIHSQELNETRIRRQVEISEIDGCLSEQYNAKLQQSLQELREQYEGQMRANRDEIEGLYKNKIKNLQSVPVRSANEASSVIDELHASITKVEALTSRVVDLEASKAALSSRIRDLESLLEVERGYRNKDIADSEMELDRLRDEMQQQLQEYQDLMDIKVSLDLEIAAYDKLLRCEEHRLNITPSTQNTANASSLSQPFQSHSTRATPGRRTPTCGLTDGAKRKRIVVVGTEDRSLSEYFITSSAKGEIEIIESDPEGRFVKLHNKGNKEIKIGDWQLLRTVGTNETSFKFHRSVKIDAGGVITIWSSDIGINHEPPANIFMIQQKWFVGDNMKTLLINSDGEDVAGSELVKQNVSSHASRHISSIESTYTGGSEELYHQQGDPEGQEK